VNGDQPGIPLPDQLVKLVSGKILWYALDLVKVRLRLRRKVKCVVRAKVVLTAR
jgi:hypothetical protein